MLLYDRNIIVPTSEIFGYLRKSSVIFGKSSGKCSETFVKPSEQFWKIFGNLRKVVGNLRKIVLNVVISMFILYRGYYTVARRYGFYVRVARRVMFVLLYRRADDAVFDHFPKISEDFLKLF